MTTSRTPRAVTLALANRVMRAHAPSLDAKTLVKNTRIDRRSSGARRRVARVARAAIVRADASPKVVVFGGSGFVGSRVVRALADLGASVTSISKSGRVPEGAASAMAIDAEDADARTRMTEATRGADVVVSCVGVIGTDDGKMRRGNGDYNVAIIESAKAAGVKRFVYVSVASIVPDVVGKTPLMKGYFEGKTAAEACLRENFDEKDYLIVKPSFIYGGDVFSLTPPRVTKTYGDILAKVLGSGPVKALGKRAPGPIALTLAEPVSVEDVAGACAAGAMAKNASSVVDGTDDIKALAKTVR